MDSFLQDVRYALRTLTKARGFTAVAVLTLALGIGANTIVFGLVNAVLLRPLPFDHPEQLVKIWGEFSRQGIPKNWISEPELWDLRDHAQSLQNIAAYSSGNGANLTRNGSEPLRVVTTQASADLLPMLGVQPMLGRVFSAEEDRPGGGKVAVLDYNFWRSQMAADRGIVGGTIQLNDETYTIVGVLPEGFTFGGDTNMWLPLALDRANPANRGSHYLEVLARVVPGASPARASTELTALAQDMIAKDPQSYPKDSGFSLFARPLQDDLTGNARLGLFVAFAAVGLVLLIACINLANLLLARGSARGRELAVRAALGAGRLRIARQLITESVVIALVGGGCGILVAVWVTDALKNTAALAVPATRPIEIDIPVLVFALAISVGTGVLFGVVPALRTSNSRAEDALKDASRGSSAAAGRGLRSALVVAEIAAAVVVLVAAGLMLGSLRHILEVDPGFRAEHLLTARISLPASRYRDIPAANAFFNRFEREVQALPGIQAAGLTSLLPMTGQNSSGSLFIDQTETTGLTLSPVFQKPYIEVDRRTITPSFFQSMQIPVLRGRAFTADDALATLPVIVVDEEFAKRMWPDRDPIGQHLSTNAVPNVTPLKLAWRTVVGVVGHVKNASLDQLGREQAYVPLEQTPFPVRSMYLTVRTAADSSATMTSVRRVLSGLDPSVPAYEMKPMSEWLDTSVSPRRFNLLLLLAFGGLALALAGIGTYGVIAYSVSQRTQEIGIRVALGASRADVLRMVVGSGLRLAGIGVVIGIVAALAAVRFMSALLFGVNAADPATFAIVSLVLMGTAFVAAWLPARRATRVHPMIALRSE